jgi:hypothetical protein
LGASAGLQPAESYDALNLSEQELALWNLHLPCKQGAAEQIDMAWEFAVRLQSARCERT